MLEGLFQPMHLLVIFFIALLVFGPKKLPELGKGIGEGIRALKDGMKDSSVEQAKVSQHSRGDQNSRIYQPAQLINLLALFRSITRRPTRPYFSNRRAVARAFSIQLNRLTLPSLL